MNLQLGTNVHPPAPYLNQERIVTLLAATVETKIQYPEVVVAIYEAIVTGKPVLPTV